MAGVLVPLTATGYELLRVLSRNAARVMTNEAPLRRGWRKREPGGAQHVRSYVKTLRRKLGDDATGPTCIMTERGVGYRMPGPHEL